LIRNYDDWKLDTPDNYLNPVLNCCHCGNELYEGEEILVVADGGLHEDCLDDYVREVVIISREVL
jgi:hypothetical protein